MLLVAGMWAKVFTGLSVEMSTFSFKPGLGAKQGRELLPFLTGEISLKQGSLCVIQVIDCVWIYILMICDILGYKMNIFYG